MSASAWARTLLHDTCVASLRLSARSWAAATAELAAQRSPAARYAYCWSASASFAISAAGEVSSSGSLTVWSSWSSAPPSPSASPRTEVAASILSSRAALAARVMEATRDAAAGQW